MGHMEPEQGTKKKPTKYHTMINLSRKGHERIVRANKKTKNGIRRENAREKKRKEKEAGDV
jgi:hypothetical protein